MIGIFDSGIGGMAVARAVSERLPGQSVAYFGDTVGGPYEYKSDETVLANVLKGVGFLVGQGTKIAIVACGISGWTTDAVAQKYGIPVFEMTSPAANLVLRVSKRSVIGVIAGRAAVERGVFERKILETRPDARVWQTACPILTAIVEEAWTKKPETRMIVRKYLHPLKVRQVDTLVLGDPHFGVLKKIIQQKIGKRVVCVDASKAVADTVADWIEKHPEIGTDTDRQTDTGFYVTGLTKQMEKTATILFGRNARLRDYHNPDNQEMMVR